MKKKSLHVQSPKGLRTDNIEKGTLGQLAKAAARHLTFFQIPLQKSASDF
jgi:hypothetical protein